MKINILRGSLLAGVLALFGSVLFALPASAAAFDDCLDNRLCLYTAEGGTTAAGDTRKPRNYESHITPQTYSEFDNETKSAWNKTGYWACLYTETKWGGSVQAVAPGAKVPTLSAELKAQGAGVSSHKFAPSMALCSTGHERCPEDSLCLFKEKNGRGEMTALKRDDNAYSAAWDNQVESVRNRTQSIACFYPDAAQSGQWTTTAPNATYTAYTVLRGDTTNLTAPFADSISSHKLDANSDSNEDCKP
ncbi:MULTISPECIES: peptidase inhibitor family I36 protein [unclassified Streptomyces]|uniref:peptidase inhibitor family I36 protein n=1 Tax=unclassified Streptomyces TaxID=2593676 RepID=UPI000DC7E913|nr:MULTISPECIES: peptidase inhibitor family I36 protein [unclassified Streptomyces]AWZ04916.1 hypothetical protein DRB89_09940 [Streptomyces sp. ICC4]AWZ13281.1 hypothetical protein DRB96_14220 [Streptomyces sp. ICC1]